MSYEDTNDGDVGIARSFSPADAVNASVVDERGEDELRRLMSWGGGEDGNNHGSSSDSMPPDRDAVDILEQVHPERVNGALANEDTGVDADRDGRFGDKGSAKCREGGDKICHCEAGLMINIRIRSSVGKIFGT